MYPGDIGGRICTKGCEHAMTIVQGQARHYDMLLSRNCRIRTDFPTGLFTFGVSHKSGTRKLFFSTKFNNWAFIAYVFLVQALGDQVIVQESRLVLCPIKFSGDWR